MKFFVAFACLVSAAYAGVIAPAAILNTGASAQFRSQDNLGNYAFGYDENHATGGTFRKESGSPGVQVGSYGLRDADGRVRVVNYVADGLGFRANIQTNEPGVEPKDPAAVLINKAPVAVAAAPVVAAAAPVVAAAPIAHAAPYVAAPYVAAPSVASYSVGINHGAYVAPYAAPAIATAHYAAPLVAGIKY